jgi:hypothetical protein
VFLADLAVLVAGGDCRDPACFPVYTKGHRSEPVGGSLVECAGLMGVRSMVVEGSRARAMSMRQASCELEIVPSLQVKPAGAASATGAGFSGVAACWGATRSVAGFWKRAQSAQQSEINRTTTPNRISKPPATRPAADMIGFVSRQSTGLRHLQHTTAGHDSDTVRLGRYCGGQAFRQIRPRRNRIAAPLGIAAGDG